MLIGVGWSIYPDGILCRSKTLIDGEQAIRTTQRKTEDLPSDFAYSLVGVMRDREGHKQKSPSKTKGLLFTGCCLNYLFLSPSFSVDVETSPSSPFSAFFFSFSFAKIATSTRRFC
jgi:hypothetical protein